MFNIWKITVSMEFLISKKEKIYKENRKGTVDEGLSFSVSELF